MIIPELPLNESERLTALNRYHIVDTQAELIFDDFTQLASHICETPIALISLLDKDRQWFKSKVGLAASETPREISFCGHAILQNELLEINDALEDTRFFDNPLVTGGPKIRFYAGMPLKTSEGYNLGTLCVIDQAPRKLSEKQRDALKMLARQVASQIENRVSINQIFQLNHNLAKKNLFIQGITDSVPIILGYWDQNLISQFANKTYSSWFGKQSTQVIGLSLHEFLGDELFNKNIGHAQQALAGIPQSFERELSKPDGSVIPALFQYIPHKIESGETIGFYVLVQDLSLFKQAEQDIQFTTQVFEHLTNGCIITDAQYKIISVNKAFTALTGYMAKDVVGEPPYFMNTNPFTNSAASTDLKQNQMRARIRTKDDQYIECITTIDAVLNDSGNTTKHIISFVDQTESINAHAKVKLLNSMLERTGDIAKVGGWEFDKTTKAFSYSSSLYKILASDPSVKVEHNHAHRYLTDTVQKQLLLAATECLNLDTTWSLEIPATTADKRQIWLRVTGKKITDNNMTVKLVGTFQDITEQNEAEAERIANEHAYRDTLIREVHHRIKNNLQGVTGILRNIPRQDKALAEIIDQAVTQIQSIAIIHGLQGRSRNEGVDLNELLTAVTLSIRSIWRKQITLEISSAPISGQIKETEAVPIALILNELITNAAKHHDGDNPIRITLAYDAELTESHIEILNTSANHPPIPDDTTSGMGLRFARSLLPRTGANLVLEKQNTEVITTLKLSSNVVKLQINEKVT